MLTYVYHCARCGDFEQQQSIADSPLKSCPQCGGPVERVVTGGTSVATKGRGSCSPASAGGG